MATAAQRKKRQERRAVEVERDLQFAAVPVEVLNAAAESTSIPSFESVAYSGGKLFVKGFGQPVVVDLDGMEVNANASILLDHDSTKRVGHPESIRVKDGQIVASGRISAETDHADEVISSHRNGFRWQMSIGARVIKATAVPQGRVIVVNGRRHEGPFILATQSKLNEISFVGSGGDEENQVRIAAQRGNNSSEGDDSMAKKANTEDQSTDQAVDQSDGEQNTDLAASASGATESTDTTTAPNAGSVNVTVNADIQAFRDEMATESTRVATIQKLTGDYPEIQAQAIKEGWTETKTELEVLRKERDKPDNDILNAAGGDGPFINITRGAGADSPEIAGQAIEASLCMQSGMSEERTGKQFGEDVMNRAVSAELRGIGLHYLMYRTIQASGGHYRPGVMDDATIRDFLHGERTLQAHSPGTFSHLTTSGILSNVANKLLLDSFTAVPTTIPTLFARRTVTDFKQNSSYRLAMGGELLEVPAGGEIKHGQLDEEGYTNQAKTWGRMLTLTRKDIINDDLGAFEQIPQLLGRKSALKLEKEGWSLILGNANAFFAAGNNNLITGATSALGIASLTTAEQAFMDQTDKAGDPIMLSARYLVTGTALATSAALLMNESRILMEARNTSSTSARAVPAQNPHAGKWTPISSPFANAQGLTGSSATKWWLWGDPADVPAFVVSYLNGRDTPQIESSDLDFNHLGMSWRCVFDFGVDQQDPRGAVQADGV